MAQAGGATAIEAATAHASAFDRVVLLSPGGDATDIEDMPVFVIYSKEEGFASLEESVKKSAHHNVDTYAIPGSAHAQAIFDDEQKERDVMEKIINFLQD